TPAPAWQPVVSAPALLEPGAAATVTGSGFMGLSEGSGGGVTTSTTDYPIVTLRQIDGPHTYTLPFSGFSATEVNVQVPEVPEGAYVLSVTVSGVSAGKMVTVDVPPDPPVLTSPVDGSSTNDVTPEVSGTAEPGSRVSV